MSRHKLSFGGITVETPSTWEEITNQLEDSDAPYTLADTTRDLGALQFSIAHYQDGTPPDPSPEDLLDMAIELAQSHDLGAPNDRVAVTERLRIGAASFKSHGDSIRIWYVSDGKNLAKVTYVCREGLKADQLDECERIVRSMEFETIHPA